MRLAALAARYGHRVPVRVVLHAFMSGCPWDQNSKSRTQQKYGFRCGAYMPDLNSTRPPDVPPSATGLTLIEGGKTDILPAEPDPARRRVGTYDD
ncbi:hypothetical protein [Bosea sp. AAP35]|uniref:hypothetical protein n=1 Tax=Bosea sp. AAP35 TaxID=1523417 RepID=UPI000B170A69|nr:hypothetical protein [Bosea sp. AAP35]